MANWISYSPQSGCNSGQITITAATYSELQDRLATIMAYNTGEGLTATTDIVQFSLPPTSITLDNASVVWIRDIPASGGTATKDNCSYVVYGYFSDGSVRDITQVVNATGSLTASSSTLENRHNVGVLNLTLSYNGQTINLSVDAYQSGYVQRNSPISSIVLQPTWERNIPYSGGTATKDNCSYQVIAILEDGTQMDITQAVNVYGSQVVLSSTDPTVHSAGELILHAEFEGFTVSHTITIYQQPYINPSLIITGLTFTNVAWVRDIPASGGTADYTNCSFNLIASYNNGESYDVTCDELVTYTGQYTKDENTTMERVQLQAPLTLRAFYSGLSAETLVTGYQAAKTYADEYFTIKFVENNGQFVYVFKAEYNSSAITRHVYYRVNEGEWVSSSSYVNGGTPHVEKSSTSIIFTGNIGDKVEFKATNTNYDILYSNATFYDTTHDYTIFKVGFSNYLAYNAKYIVEGNILSLIYGDNFRNNREIHNNRAFYGLFAGAQNLSSAKNLVLPDNVTDRCYGMMFYDCSSLTEFPKLPATTLAPYCYNGMFALKNDNSIVTTLPDNMLPATTLAEGCYMRMFAGRTKLITIPLNLLPATTLAPYCYNGMFQMDISAYFSGSSLTQAPELPATTLAPHSYTGMFSDCTSLTTAPELLTATLPDYCYADMFSKCTNLNYIKCLAINKGNGAVDNWLSNVSPTGTFIKHPNATWSRGVYGIPDNWTIIDADIS